jgi:hypothetical protein
MADSTLSAVLARMPRNVVLITISKSLYIFVSSHSIIAIISDTKAHRMVLQIFVHFDECRTFSDHDEHPILPRGVSSRQAGRLLLRTTITSIVKLNKNRTCHKADRSATHSNLSCSYRVG